MAAWILAGDVPPAGQISGSGQPPGGDRGRRQASSWVRAPREVEETLCLRMSAQKHKKEAPLLSAAALAGFSLRATDTCSWWSPFKGPSGGVLVNCPKQGGFKQKGTRSQFWRPEV